MNDPINTDHELSKHEESQQEVPPGQAPEPEEPQAPAVELDPIKKLQDELAEAREKYVRLYAEFENHRRRTSKEKLEMILGANEQLIKSLLPVLDDFERAEKSFRESSSKEAEGLLLVHNKYKKVLEQYGVKVMEITSDTIFDADLHEAITQVPVTDESKKGKVVDVVEKGYLLNDKVIRFAKVVVGS